MSPCPVTSKNSSYFTFSLIKPIASEAILKYYPVWVFGPSQREVMETGSWAASHITSTARKRIPVLSSDAPGHNI